MTTVMDREQRERQQRGSDAGTQSDVDRRFRSIVLASLLSRREERERSEEINPLVFALLGQQRRQERSPGINPLLIAALVGRQGREGREGRDEQEQGRGGVQDILPLVLAATAWRRHERSQHQDVTPVVLAALMNRQGREERGGVEDILPLIATMGSQRHERGGEDITPVVVAALAGQR